ncbi:MAG: DUF429 domain-containing protein [Rhodoferax sp.]|uniref:DUF429 domain-containing protein n=1 Tax=Rhodoferax sp. TaxID=50421 RepID=UPI001B4FF69F|nr:DUF429 domain-containing protein [Rhodoferax sp.]MBP9147633.1 DUF429 domain-containing protein [Rhodoferax sp.]MBP9737363.1 DUF429 domain-containing protein [Rhodoferax sp.]
MAAPARVVGCDFSSAPTHKKPIVIAVGTLSGACVALSHLRYCASLREFSAWLAEPSSWTGAFDLPFGLPRELVQTLGWPLTWRACISHFAGLSRAEIRQTFVNFCAQRPVGGKFTHRETDRPAGSSPSMKWVNPPVAFMLHAGIPCLLQAGVLLPGLDPGASSNLDAAGQPQRVALEAYPGLLAREILGRRSYKSDDRSRQTADRLIARKDLITALEHGKTRLQLRLKVSHAQRDQLVDDAKGDCLDAVLCMLQAAWAQCRHENGHPAYGLPADIDPLEGWIVSA